MRANFLETNPIPVKAALAMMGRISEVCRLPMVKLSEAARGKLAAVLSSLNLLPPQAEKSL
jgi:4-hydroxy-tetrahydrodipicolinate synthase